MSKSSFFEKNKDRMLVEIWHLKKKSISKPKCPMRNTKLDDNGSNSWSVCAGKIFLTVLPGGNPGWACEWTERGLCEMRRRREAAAAAASAAAGRGGTKGQAHERGTRREIRREAKANRYTVEDSRLVPRPRIYSPSLSIVRWISGIHGVWGVVQREVQQIRCKVSYFFVAMGRPCTDFSAGRDDPPIKRFFVQT